MVHLIIHPVNITLQRASDPDPFPDIWGLLWRCSIFIHKLGRCTIGIKDMVFIIYFAFVG